MNVKLILFAFLVLLMLSSVFGQGAKPAATPAPSSVAFDPGPCRQGFINLERALMDVAEGKQLFGELQVFIDKKNKELDAIRNDISRKETQVRAQETTLSDEAKLTSQRDMEEQRTKLTRFQEDTSKLITDRQNGIIKKIGDKMQSIIVGFAKEKKLTSIIIWSPQLYAYVDETLNVTDEIIKRYDVANPAPAAASATTAKPKTP